MMEAAIILHIYDNSPGNISLVYYFRPDIYFPLTISVVEMSFSPGIGLYVTGKTAGESGILYSHGLVLKGLTVSAIKNLNGKHNLLVIL
jgi:hypothetical protein